MPSSTTELIKSKLDIVEVLRAYITLQPAGKNLKALCPFHGEKTPSFIVSPDRQTWHCFGCGAGGDMFTFVMKYENLEFTDALRVLAEKAGVELRHENPAEYRYSGLLYDLNNAAKNFFRKALTAAPVAREYLASRGLTPETVDEFEIGWAPNEPEALTMALLNHGQASPQDLIQAGISLKTERGLMLDRFRGRIMFPIHNHLGKVVGFTGRILPQLDQGMMGKYINSPETPIFQKSKLLYGFWKSKEGIRASKTAVLVEGQMDYLMTWQSGVKNVIASSGTALTAEHLRAIHRLAEELVLSFDNDTAGSDAAERAIDLAEAADFTVKVAMLDDAMAGAIPGVESGSIKDAADAVKADPESMKRVIAAAMPAPEFYFKKYLPTLPKGAGPEAMAAALRTRDGLQRLRAVLTKLRRMASPIERDAWMRELSRHTDISVATLEEEAARIEMPQAAVSPFASRNAGQGNDAMNKRTDNGVAGEASAVPERERERTRRERLGEELLAIAVAKGDFSFMEDATDHLAPSGKEVYEILKRGEKKSEDATLDALIEAIMVRDMTDTESATAEDIKGLKEGLAKEYYKERRQVLTLAVRNAETRGDEKELSAALNELRKLPAE